MTSKTMGLTGCTVGVFKILENINSNNYIFKRVFNKFSTNIRTSEKIL